MVITATSIKVYACMLGTNPPALLSPQPPCHDLTNLGSAIRETGLNEPVLKYGPTGDSIQYNKASLGSFTPSVG